MNYAGHGSAEAGGDDDDDDDDQDGQEAHANEDEDDTALMPDYWASWEAVRHPMRSYGHYNRPDCVVASSANRMSKLQVTGSGA